MLILLIVEVVLGLALYALFRQDYRQKFIAPLVSKLKPAHQTIAERVYFQADRANEYLAKQSLPVKSYGALGILVALVFLAAMFSITFALCFLFLPIAAGLRYRDEYQQALEAVEQEPEGEERPVYEDEQEE